MFGSKYLLGNLVHTNFPADGLYQFRLRSWTILANGRLGTSSILCQKYTAPKEDNKLVLFIDNRGVGDSSGHPAFDHHPCGHGTIHHCSLEPDTDIADVKIIHNNGSSSTIGPCRNIVVASDIVVQIDFFAYDKDSHPAWYSLISTGKKNEVRDVLCYAQSHTGKQFPVVLPLLEYGLHPLAAGSPGIPSGIPKAAQVGPDYIAAIGKGAIPPVWAGGAMRIIVPALDIFPETCCYRLEIRAYKQTIIGCQHDETVGHANWTQYRLGIQVP